MTTMDETVIMIRHTFFWGRESSSFFFMLVFLSSRFKCRLLHFSLKLYSFLHRLILESAFVKKCRKCSSSTSKVDCHKMMLMIRRASRDPGRDFTMNENAIFFLSDLLYSKPRDKKQHCHLRFCRRPSVEKRFRRVHGFYLLQKKMVLPARMNFFPRCLRIDAAFSLQELILRR